MKKNITINLLGRLYAIDEDAYELLKEYTDSLHAFFRRREGGEEIVADIEARIAELFDELKANGTEAITIEHVQDIIHRVGSPEEMESPLLNADEGEERSRNNNDGSTRSQFTSHADDREGSKRLYRNLADKKFMGVLSGLAAYFGGDVLWWRMGYLVLLCFNSWAMGRLWLFHNWGIHLNGTLLLLYFALAILMPVADTPEDRLRMKGKPVTPQNLADEVSQPTETPTHESNNLGCISGFFYILGTMLRWFLYGLGIALSFSMLAGVIALLAAMTVPHSVIHVASPEFWTFFEANQRELFITALLCLIALIIPTYCILHGLFHEFGQLLPMGFRQRVTMLIMWLIVFVAAAVACTTMAAKVRDYVEENDAKHHYSWNTVPHAGTQMQSVHIQQ